MTRVTVTRDPAITTALTRHGYGVTARVLSPFAELS